MATNITADVSLNIRELMREKKISSEAEFGRVLDVSKHVVSKWKERNTYNVDKIVSAFPDVNRTWLITGEGSMLNPSEGAKADISGTIVATDEESYSEALQAGLALTPEYSTVFHGGQGISSEGQNTVAHWHIPNAPKDAVIIPMLGNSMSPRFNSGSRLVVRPIEFFTPTSITFGDVFAVVVQDEYGYDPATHIKILRRHKDSAKERTHWIARSVNRDEYDDFDIDISRVSKLYKVIGSVDLFEIM